MQKRVMAAGMAMAMVLALSGMGLAALDVTTNNDADALVADILGPGVTLVTGSASLTGAGDASGTFTFNGLTSPPGIGIDTGIILATGNVTDAEIQNIFDYTGTTFGTAGDADLTALISEDTVDAASLQFQFTTAQPGTLQFEFVFASEEYLDFVEQFNDGFGAFLNGINMALVPNTTDPISVNNIYTGKNPTFYRDNPPSFSAPFNVTYDGLTTVITAKSANLQSGKHTMKLAIADAKDRDLDSAVFIKSSSFTLIPSGDPGTLAVPVDVKPGGCPNPLNVASLGVTPIAVLGFDNFDVTKIDPASVKVAGVAPVKWAVEDVATPYKPFTGKVGCDACTTEGPDGRHDLVLHFNTQALVSALGAVKKGDCLVLSLTGKLKAEFDGTPIEGEDVVRIIKNF